MNAPFPPAVKLGGWFRVKRKPKKPTPAGIGWEIPADGMGRAKKFYSARHGVFRHLQRYGEQHLCRLGK